MISATLPRRAVLVLATLALAFGGLVTRDVEQAVAASPSPAPNPNIQLSAEPMLGGRFDAGSWAAFRVLVENTGPALDGELRVGKPAQDGSTFSRKVQLAPGARQEHVLYGQVGPLTNRFVISLVSGGSTVASVNSTLDPAGEEPGVFVVAERPEPLVGLLSRVLGGRAGGQPEIASGTPELLPPRAEAWSALDLLVWQDVDFNRLSGEHRDALLAWLTLGGELVIVGGSTGASTLGAFPPDLLPYQPAAVVDVPVADLQALLGTLPPDATNLPALAGSLERGTTLAQSGSSVIAARAPVGQGGVVLVGLDVSAPWVSASAADSPFWSRAFSAGGARDNGLIMPDESYIINALGSLPSVQVPPFEMLALLLIAYVIAIGPINYFALRRRDRREWAWLTMPATIAVFAIGAYGLGVLLKGGDVVVNQLAVVHSATGSDRGLANVYVGVYSPSRATFDVNVDGNALLAAPDASEGMFDRGPSTGERPVDVVLGDPATVRGYSVGFGTLRGFRAQAQVAAPRIDSDLRLVGQLLEGTIVNAAQQSLSNVAVVYGGAVSILGDLAPGESRSVSLEARNSSGSSLAERLVPNVAGLDSAATRTFASRRALVHHLEGGRFDDFFFDGQTRGVQSAVFRSGPVILSWQSGPTLDVQPGGATEQVGERLYVIAARAAASGPAVFTGGSVQHQVIESDNVETGDFGGGVLYMGRGTMTVDYWPLSFDGAFKVSALSVELTRASPATPSTAGEPLSPLPSDQQPDPNQPLASGPDATDPVSGLPAVQLYDRAAATWVGFPPLGISRTYLISDPGRYVDSTGTVRVRFVVRGFDEYAEFSFGVRLEGTIE